MRPNLYLKKRKGLSVIEELVCLVLFAMVLVLVLRALAMSSEWTGRTRAAYQDVNNLTTFTTMFQSDIKSALELSATADELTLIGTEEIQVYTISDTKVFRNDVMVLDNLASGMFVPDVDSTTAVGVYLCMKSGEVLDMKFSR